MGHATSLTTTRTEASAQCPHLGFLVHYEALLFGKCSIFQLSLWDSTTTQMQAMLVLRHCTNSPSAKHPHRRIGHSCRCGFSAWKRKHHLHGWHEQRGVQWSDQIHRHGSHCESFLLSSVRPTTTTTTTTGKDTVVCLLHPTTYHIAEFSPTAVIVLQRRFFPLRNRA